ncbi:MAG: CatA-like O-acetyltransferase [Rikenellaceae bacterium]
MGRIKIDIESWSRRNEFAFFITMMDPNISITSDVDVQSCYASAKRRGESFFVYYSYAIIRALNEIESFRLRAVSEPLGSEPEVYLYDVVDMISPIKISEEGKYIEMRFEYTPSFEEFYRKAIDVIASAPAAAESEEIFFTMNEKHTYACISAMPKLYFTGVKHACTNQGGVNMLSLINVGKMVTRDGRSVIPIALSAHHGLVDGGHISDFFARVQEILDSL